jgi:hypothetical protein
VDFVKFYDQDDTAEIEALLLGHSVAKVSCDQLLLDDGTELTLEGHVGGCSCGAGDYDLTDLNGVDNIITKVEFEDNPGSDYSDGEYYGFYRIFVFAGDKKVNLASFEGTDGNGWYGTGYNITVKIPTT